MNRFKKRCHCCGRLFWPGNLVEGLIVIFWMIVGLGILSLMIAVAYS